LKTTKRAREETRIIDSTELLFLKESNRKDHVFGIGAALQFAASPSIKNFDAFEYETVKICTEDTKREVQFCGNLELKDHNKGRPYVLTKEKKTTFNMKVVCTGAHERLFEPLELVLFVDAKLKDGSTIRLHSPTFFIQGSRDSNRKPRQLPSKPPQTAPEPSLPNATYDPCPGTIQTSTVEETDHQQTLKSSPDQPTLQLNIPEGSNTEPDFLERYYEEDLLSDFRGCRLEN
jgi:hypothetical protein